MYQVWTKNEFSEEWVLSECADEEAVKEAVLAATRSGREALVSAPMEFSIDVTIQDRTAIEEFPRAAREPKIKPGQKKEDQSEVKASGPESDRDPGAESHGPV